MPKKVADTPENMEICKKFCGPCPTFQANKLKEVAPHALFCARGASEKKSDDIEQKGCSCFGCPIFPDHELEGGYFCVYGIEGKK
ncbi:MAG: DUF2769 domain-containing protein [Asgard group archaeon]|nr:DUF2769 domain-containing protein [Asgard group archaeon]